MTTYDHAEIEKKWQKRWESEGLYTADIKGAEKPFYNLWMFPYPSAEGLHAGHAFASTGSDVYGRFMRMQGYNIFQPIGYDSFGIHSENFALKIGDHPKNLIDRAARNYQRQFKSMGHGYDWSRIVTTSDSDYYRWTQWLFVQMFKAGLAYKKKAPVNWCPSCKTVLADEQIFTPAAAGKWPKQYKTLNDVPEGIKVCERCGSEPEKKELEQWFFKITQYADRLLAGLDKIDWSERVVTAQRNWIGRKEGMKIRFDDIEVFTTRPDTLSGATFVALPAPELGREGDKAKIGKFTGRYVTNPLTGEKIPVWKANYVAAEYGSGAIMGVPAHDERDREFAAKYKIPTRRMEPDKNLWEKIEKEGWGSRTTHYHLRDWLISRQRYWGPPIPMIFCSKCNWQPVPEADLPVILPDISDYQPEGTGKGPLANHPEFYKTICPNCGGEATRETDVSDTFVDSSWYFLRYPSVGSSTAGKLAFDPEITKKWLPVSLYFGGAEHAVLHLMYARFVTMVLHDLKIIDFEEPFPRFFAHGLMIKDGAKMSKSRGNVVNPDEYIAKYGADALRLYLMFMGPMDGYPDFRDSGMEGMVRFVNRVWRLSQKIQVSADPTVLIKLHQTIKSVVADIGQFKYNTAIAAIMELVNICREKGIDRPTMEKLTLLLAPFAPHVAEEIWHNLGNKTSVHLQAWPLADEELTTADAITIVVQINGKVRDRLIIEADLASNQAYVHQSALASARIKSYLKESKYQTIFVPGKLINFVT